MKKWQKALWFALPLLLFSASVFADVGILDNVTRSYQTNSAKWYGKLFPIAQSLFGYLAAIEFAWSAALWALEKDELGSFASVVIKKMLSIGFFYALLLNAGAWIPAIINSMSQAGQQASGLSQIHPQQVFDIGLKLAGKMIQTLSTMHIWQFSSVVILDLFAALIIALAYAVIAGQLVVALVESYIAVSAGVLWLGFGGSRWTVDFTQKYISYAFGTGAKLFILYLIIGLGQDQTTTWIANLNAQDSAQILSVLAGAVVFMFLAWQIPSIASSLLSGSPSMTLGSGLATAATVAAGALGTVGAAGGALHSVGSSVAPAGSIIGGAAGATGNAVLNSLRNAVPSMAGGSVSGGGDFSALPVNPPSPPPAPPPSPTPPASAAQSLGGSNDGVAPGNPGQAAAANAGGSSVPENNAGATANMAGSGFASPNAEGESAPKGKESFLKTSFDHMRNVQPPSTPNDAAGGGAVHIDLGHTRD